MSQKLVSKGVSNNSPKTVPKSVSKDIKISQVKTVKKSEEKTEEKRNPNLIQTNSKGVKNSVKTVNTISDKKKTTLTTTQSKTKPESISKSSTKTLSKPLIKNSKTKISNQPNIKSNGPKPISSKNNEINGKEITVKRVAIKTDNQQTINKKIEQGTKKKDTPLEKKQLLTNNEKIVEKETKQTQLESEDHTNKESSDEQYVSLPTFGSYSSYKKSHKSSESIQAEPPSICDTDIEDMINNTTDNQINDDFPSDYCDDFEDYESDFEDDDDTQEDEEEFLPQENEYEHLGEQEIHKNHTEFNQRNIFIEKHEKQTIEKNLSQKSVTKVNNNSDVAPIQTIETNTKVNDSYNTFTQSVKSAKIKSEFEIQRNKTIKRSKELLEIIKLDEISFTNFDLPQINYELFIKTFGRKDTKQVSSQTSEREDNETQTDFIQISEKWTQNPSFTRLVSGDQNQMNEDNLSNDFEPKVKPFELIQFLNKAETLMSAIIDIECDNPTISKRSLPKGSEQFSTNISVIKCLSLAKKCPINHMFVNSLYLFCVQNVSKIEGSAEKSMISVWSLMAEKTEPIKVLICRSHITNAFSEQNLVIAAMIDGSIALWDLNQQSLCDKELKVEGTKFMLRTPSYNCALTSKGHDFPIVDIKRLFDNESGDGIVHFGTIDENCTLIVWAVTEGKEETNESLLSQTNEHRIARISIKNYLEDFDFKSSSVRITAMECQPTDWSTFFCGTDNGCVIRFTNIEETVNNLPKIYQKSQLNSIWTKVTEISFNTSESSRFLVGFTDGILSYYSITDEKPLIIFNSNELPIIDFKWIPKSSQMSFIALNNSNQILIWDMNNEQHFKPIVKYRHSNDRIMSIALWKGLKTYLIFGCDSGQTLVFDFCIQ